MTIKKLLPILTAVLMVSSGTVAQANPPSPAPTVRDLRPKLAPGVYRQESRHFGDHCEVTNYWDMRKKIVVPCPPLDRDDALDETNYVCMDEHWNFVSFDCPSDEEKQAIKDAPMIAQRNRDASVQKKMLAEQERSSARQAQEQRAHQLKWYQGYKGDQHTVFVSNGIPCHTARTEGPGWYIDLWHYHCTDAGTWKETYVFRNGKLVSHTTY